MLRAGSLWPLIDSLAALAVALLVMSLLLRVDLAAFPLFLLAGAYLIAEASGHCATISIVAYAAGLIVLCELQYWSKALPGTLEVDRAVTAHRLLALALIGGSAGMLSLITLAAAFLKLPEALGAVTLGAAASVTLLGLALLVARKSHPGR